MHDSDEDFSGIERDESAPMDMLAALFEARGWPFESGSDEEVSAEFKGSWTNYQIRAVWRSEDNSLQVIVLPDVTVPDEKRTDIYRALGLINEQLWIGHFDVWSSNGILLFRHGSLLPANGLLGIDQAQTIIDVAIDECERFYPVFQFIIWGDKSPEDAIASAMVETHGEA
ncbi:MAG: YbjN domain-containing protein [Sphingorhabdus sp.]|nr:YbjN domain-containing protein [Sphingorhabdus sp.]